MKRKKLLYEKICSIENLKLADSIARKGKSNQPSIINHDKNKEENIKNLRELLLTKKFKTSEYNLMVLIICVIACSFKSRFKTAEED